MNERHLEKIRKCLALAEGSNPNEAALAMEMAQKLMRKYGVCGGDIEFIDMAEVKTTCPIQKSPVNYLAALVNRIASTFNVLPFVTCDLGSDESWLTPP